MRVRMTLLAAGLLALAGCGPTTAGVSGAVTYDGQMVEFGSITFVPTDGTGKKFGGPIDNGKYAVTPEFGGGPGAYKVEIRWNKPTGKKVFNADLNQQMDVMAEGLPDKYHKTTELTATLKAGPNEVNFDLKK